jgi:monothiol glutaredoxin
MDDTVKTKIENAINSKPVLLFMKGTPEAPMCGFSAGVVQVLNRIGVDYGSFNILADESVRQGLKEYSNWPTFPQLYVNGELVGGHDIVMQMVQSGELQKKLGVAAES